MPLVELQHLTKEYNLGKPVVSDISFSIEAGESLALFGISGSGKSTIGQVLAGIIKPTSGQVRYRDEVLSWPFQKMYRQKIQVLFQHPEVSFNPRMTLLQSMKETYRFRKTAFREQELLDYLEAFGIYKEHLARHPIALSGGELQRIALSRVMLMEPDFLVLDEPTSMLDVISQAQVIRILKKLQQDKNLGYLFISHDLELCRMFCDKILKLENGRIAGAL